MGRRLAGIGVTLVMVAVAALPLVLTLALGWYETDVLNEPLGAGSDIWVILVVFYAVWMPLCVAGLIALYDRVGLHYQHVDRPPRETRRQRRRRESGMSYLRAGERSQAEASRSEKPSDGEG